MNGFVLIIGWVGLVALLVVLVQTIIRGWRGTWRRD